MSRASDTRRSLNELARHHGIQLGYTGHDGRRVIAPVDSLLAVLGALGHPVEDAASIAAALDVAREELATQVIEPVVVHRPGASSVSVCLDPHADPADVVVAVTTDAGTVEEAPLDRLATTAGDVPDSDRRRYEIDLSSLHLPRGYHRLALSGPGLDAESLVLARPVALAPPPRSFGVMAPLYALRGPDDWGAGDLGDLVRLAATVDEWGGRYVGTLPLYAADFHQPVDPSPYLPYSRLFWNELFVDVEALPEAGAPLVRAVIDAAGFRTELEKLRAEPMVDYAAVMDRKREVLALCAAELASAEGARRDQYEAYVAGHPELAHYAEFRAADDGATQRWRSWPSSPGRLPAAALDPAVAAYHKYVQFVVAEQLGAAGRAGAGLYLDFPVGVHPDGYDTWAYAEVFADAGVGAPPDEFFAGGQSWGFPPLHPDVVRRSGYRYLIDAYRTAFAAASAVRIDHVLGLHRMFWIPSGLDATQGAYVTYPHEELRAIIAIEAERAGAVVVGEDLGTVTPAIRNAMDRDGVLHTFISRFAADEKDPFPQPRTPSAASLGSHDLPKFAAYWRGEDIEDRLGRGEIDATAADVERAERDALIEATAKAAGIKARALHTDAAVRAGLVASLASLAGGPADLLLVDLADLVGQRVPDNRPGTGPEADNWRWRLSRRLDEIAADPAVTSVIEVVHEARVAEATEGVSR